MNMASGFHPSCPQPPHPIPLASPEALSLSTCSPFAPCCTDCPTPAPSRLLFAPQVICCEGNAGFYEVGCVSTPLEGKHLALTSYLCPLHLSVSPPMLASPGLTSVHQGEVQVSHFGGTIHSHSVNRAFLAWAEANLSSCPTTVT